MQRTACLLLSFPVSLLAISTFAQAPPDKTSIDEKVIHVGIAPSVNQSRRMVATSWARSQLIRELNSFRKDKHSPVLIEAVPLEASDREDALMEASEKNYDYIVTTLVIDPVRAGTVVVGPGGLQQNPQILGNVDPDRQLAIKFAILRLGSPRPISEGVTTAPAEDGNDIAATTDAMHRVAARVAHEIRKYRPPISD